MIPESIEGREDFIRANAVSLVQEKEAYIEKLRDRIRKLEKSVQATKAANRQLRSQLRSQLPS